tara:strand:+ start:399 stop:659 length:261 start_codon:yes stop_codon:yes gene_type:complete
LNLVKKLGESPQIIDNNRVFHQSFSVFFDTPARDSLDFYGIGYKVKFVNDTFSVYEYDSEEYLPSFISLKNKKMKDSESSEYLDIL